MSDHGHEEKPQFQIQQTTVGAEQPVQLAATTRWEYLKKYLPLWQATLAYETYQNVFFGLGIIALLAGSPLAVLAFFISLYFRGRKAHRHHEITSSRRIITAN